MGLNKAGYECVGTSEIKESSIQIYKNHYPEHRNYGDITKIVPESLPDFDIITGGFPCQSFSIAGLGKGFKDRRGKMIFYIYDILKAKKPKYGIFENVMGLKSHDDGKTYEKIFKLLMSAGYKVRALEMSAANHGSAQCRERLVFICRLNEDFPRVDMVANDNTKTFRDVRDHDESHFNYIDMTEKNIAKFSTDSKAFGFKPVGGYDRIKTMLTGMNGDFRRSCVAQEEDGRFRYLTMLEAERLQGFPDGWTDGQTPKDRWFGLGNAVNCNMSEYLCLDYLKKLWWN